MTLQRSLSPSKEQALSSGNPPGEPDTKVRLSAQGSGALPPASGPSDDDEFKHVFINLVKKLLRDSLHLSTTGPISLKAGLEILAKQATVVCPDCKQRYEHLVYVKFPPGQSGHKHGATKQKNGPWTCLSELTLHTIEKHSCFGIGPDELDVAWCRALVSFWYD